ncbi:MAG: hypothetical protein KAH22_00285 [Thiotrichaceae bacterium]|nr:hypothetical protein [Thiotrichaceae bacterium]
MNPMKSADYSPHLMTVHNKVKLCIADQKPKTEGVLNFKGKNYMIENVKNLENPTQLESRFSLAKDLSLEDVRYRSGREFPHEIRITCDCSDDLGYENSSYYHFLNSEQELQISFECNYWFEDWEHKVELLSFMEIFLSALAEYKDLDIQKNVLFEEGMINLHFTQQHAIGHDVDLIINALEHRLRNEHIKALDWYDIGCQLDIKKTSQSSARAILNYISDLIAEQNIKDNDIVVSLNQQGQHMSMGFKFPSTKIYLLNKILCEQAKALVKRSDQMKATGNYGVISNIKLINLLNNDSENQHWLDLVNTHIQLDQTESIELYEHLSKKLLELATGLRS